MFPGHDDGGCGKRALNPETQPHHIMKTLLQPAAALAFLALAVNLPAAQPTPAGFDKLPDAVKAAILREAGDGRIEEVKTVTKDGVTTHIAEVDHKDDSDLDVHVAPDGKVLRTVADLRIQDAPEPVRAALKSLAADTGKAEDLRKVTEDGKITYKAEIDRTGAADLKVKLAADGAVLEQREENQD